MATSFEAAKSFLQKASPTGVSVYDHLSDLILKILREAPPDAVADLETLSARVKAERLHPERLHEGRPADPDKGLKDAIAGANVATLSLFPAPSPDDAEPAESIANDVVSDATLLRCAGVGSGDEATFRLGLQIAQLETTLVAQGAVKIRWFGTITGVKGDYTVVEVKLGEPGDAPEGLEAARGEAPGQGANEYAYWVLPTLTGTWARLPDVLPEQIRVSRSKKRLLTGDLNASVGGAPHFRWPEASYLRAMIARIATATLIAPAGFYEDKGADEGGVVPAEAWDAPKAAVLATADGWVHERAALLKQGRVVPWVPPEADPDADPPAEQAPAEDVEEAIPALRSLSEDTTDVAASAWSFRVSPGAHPVVTAMSLTWPGAVTVAKGKSFVSVYVGDGVRQTATAYAPVLPSAFQAEFKDDEEEPKLKEQEDPLPPPAEEKPTAEETPA